MYEWKISGSNMKEDVVIQTSGKTPLQAIFRAKEEVEKLELDWDEIEYVI